MKELQGYLRSFSLAANYLFSSFYFFLFTSIQKLAKFKCYTAQKLKFSVNGFFNKYDQIHRKLKIWAALLKKSLTENFIFFVQC